MEKQCKQTHLPKFKKKKMKTILSEHQKTTPWSVSSIHLLVHHCSGILDLPNGASLVDARTSRKMSWPVVWLQHLLNNFSQIWNFTIGTMSLFKNTLWFQHWNMLEPCDLSCSNLRPKPESNSKHEETDPETLPTETSDCSGRRSSR